MNLRRRTLVRIGIPLTLLIGLAAPVAGATAREGVPSLAVKSAVANVHWKQGWLQPGAGVSFKGTVGAASSLTAVLRPVARPGVVTSVGHFDIAKAGSFTEKIHLPPRPLPGQYRLKVSGKSGDAALTPVELTLTIAGPSEGVVDRVQVGTTRNGPWLLYSNNSAPVVHGSYKELWMRFRFLSPPNGQSVELVWKMKWHVVVGKVLKRYNNTIDTFVKSGAPLPSGHWVAVLKIGGRVAKTMDVIIR